VITPFKVTHDRLNAIRNFGWIFWCGRPDHALSHHPKNIIMQEKKSKTNHVSFRHAASVLSPCVTPKRNFPRGFDKKKRHRDYYIITS
jgi:hypothetical protein